MTITSTFANVNVGAESNDGTGDPLRTSFIKINENFQYITDKIWPNLQVDPPSLTADITSSYISDFNLITATDILVTKPGGATITANTFIGNLINVNYFSTNLLSVNSVSVTGNIVSANLTTNSNISTGNIQVSNSISGTGSTIVSNIKHYVYSTDTSTLNTQLVESAFITLSTLSNTAYNMYNIGNASTFITNVFYNDITPGVVRTYIFQNNLTSSATRYIVLPTSFNNKGTANITLSPLANVMMQFISYDNTAANVYVFVANN